MAKRTKKKAPARFGKPGNDPDKEHNDKPNRHRVRPSDLHQAMHTTKEQGRVVSNQAPSGEVLVFTITGKEDDRVTLSGNVDVVDGYPLLFDEELDDGSVVIAENRNEAYAKLEATDTGVYYYIKRGPNGHFFNPIGLYDEGKHQKRHAGESVWVFKEVNKRAFEYYLKFLQNRNKAWLTNAEREAI